MKITTYAMNKAVARQEAIDWTIGVTKKCRKPQNTSRNSARGTGF